MTLLLVIHHVLRLLILICRKSILEPIPFRAPEASQGCILGNRRSKICGCLRIHAAIEGPLRHLLGRCAGLQRMTERMFDVKHGKLLRWNQCPVPAQLAGLRHDIGIHGPRCEDKRGEGNELLAPLGGPHGVEVNCCPLFRNRFRERLIIIFRRFDGACPFPVMPRQGQQCSALHLRIANPSRYPR